MDDVMVKSSEEERQNEHMSNVFCRFQKYNMSLNPEKYNFEIISNKFLSFYMEERGI